MSVAYSASHLASRSDDVVIGGTASATPALTAIISFLSTGLHMRIPSLPGSWPAKPSGKHIISKTERSRWEAAAQGCSRIYIEGDFSTREKL